MWFSSYKPIHVKMDNIKFWDLNTANLTTEPPEDLWSGSPPSTSEPQSHTPTATPHPSWVTDFAEPILAAIEDLEPNFQDDFSTNTNSWRGYPSWPVIGEGVMQIIEEHGDAKNVNFYDKQDFVLKVDISPPNTCCVHVNIGEYSIYKGPMAWGICSPDTSDCSGIPGSANSIMAIVKGSQLGFYRDVTPAAYFDDPNLVPDVRFSCDNFCEFDNVKFWNLDGVEFSSSAVDEQPAEDLLYSKQVFQGTFTDLDWGTNGQIAAIGDESSAFILDAATGEINQDFNDPEQVFRALAWHPNGESLTFGTASGILRFYQFQDTWQGPWDIYTLTYYGGINDISYTADGAWLAAVVDGKIGVHWGQVGVGGYVGIWDTTDNARKISSLSI